jgi:hypothetical protein
MSDANSLEETMKANPPRKISALRPLAISAAIIGLIAGVVGMRPIPSDAAASSVQVRASPVSERSTAIAAGRVYLVENADLHLTGEGETALHERGKASGTFDAPLTANLNLSIGHVAGIFTIYPKGGSISGRAEARYTVRGSIGYYGGTLTITGGTGTYSHASGSNIGISGTINHLNFALTVKAHGWANL